MTHKDHYLLPLFEETLAQINKAKIFIKLNICQAFYQIKMDSRLEDLIIF
jgi:hypothetical protein